MIILNVAMPMPTVSANRSPQSPSLQVNTYRCKSSIDPPKITAITAVISIRPNTKFFLCRISPVSANTIKTKKKPQCTSLSKPGKKKCDSPMWPIGIRHITKTNKAHKIVSLWYFKNMLIKRRSMTGSRLQKVMLPFQMG